MTVEQLIDKIKTLDENQLEYISRMLNLVIKESEEIASYSDES